MMADSLVIDLLSVKDELDRLDYESCYLSRNVTIECVLAAESSSVLQVESINGPANRVIRQTVI